MIRGVSSSSKRSPKARSSFLAAVTKGGAGRGIEDGKACLDAMACFASWRLPLDPWAVEAALKPASVPGAVVCVELNKITLSPVVGAGLAIMDDGFGDELVCC